MERKPTIAFFNEEFLAPTQTPLQIHRSMSTGMHTLNHALTKRMQPVVDQERALLYE